MLLGNKAMAPKFSIIIPAHNEENYIRQTLHAVNSQTYQDFEVIVVANGCTDKTEEIVRKREEKERIKLLTLNIANVSRARNHGASKSAGEILFFLDADTILENDTLQKINENFGSEYAVATTLMKPDVPKLKYRLALGLKNFYNKTGIYKGCSGALICRKLDFEEANGYDPEQIVMEHKPLIKKLALKGKYGCFDTTVTSSSRRFEQWGLMKSLAFWSKQQVKYLQGKLKESDYERVR
jgi:glycosyltransferase involved in cell wall biosynthesis